MRKSSLTLVLSLVAVFLSGAVVGGFGYRVYRGPSVRATNERPKPEEYRQRFMKMMKERVKLTVQQVDQLNAIMDRTKERFHELDASKKPEKRAIFSEQNEAIVAILDDQQRVEFAKIREERAARRKKRNGNRSKDH
ncbi:MAG: hypothetical protein GY953_10010 [bacterium]|nr:hypothetical protein [bacterium]